MNNPDRVSAETFDKVLQSVAYIKQDMDDIIAAGGIVDGGRVAKLVSYQLGNLLFNADQLRNRDAVQRRSEKVGTS